MKRCPKCGREYDNSMMFCLDDGAELLYGPSTDESTTAILQNVLPSSVGLASPRKHATPKGSIAVLPFTHMSSDEDNDYFCDGLAEELINALSKIDELKVAARTSAFSFKGKDTGISEIAEQLGVRTVLEGSVRKLGDRLRITAQLINAADGYHIWSERYDRQMTDIFALQDEITLAVVEALKLKLLQSERSALLKKATGDPEAYQLYLRGRAFWNRRTPPDLRKAIGNFEQAIAIDPAYSLAYSGMTDCYTLLAYFEDAAPHDYRDQARQGGQKAIELDPVSAEAHTAMAIYYLIFEFAITEAEHHFKKALDLNPKLVTAQYLYGTHLASQRRYDEAFRHGRIALDLDPLSQPLNGNVERALYLARRYDDAVELAEKNLELAPHFFFHHWVLGVSYRQKGDLEKAIFHLGEAVSLSGITALKGDLGVALALAGREAETRVLLAELGDESQTRYVSPQWPAVIYAALGDKEMSLQYLEQAWQMRSVQLIWLGVDPNFDPLRREPEFLEILKKSPWAV